MRRARRFNAFLLVAIAALLIGGIFLTVQWMREREAAPANLDRDVAALKMDIDSLGGRVTNLERSSSQAQSAGTTLADVAARLSAIEAETARAAERDTINALQDRLARLEMAAPSEMLKRAAAALARANLARAAEGDAPFGTELEALRAAAPDDPALQTLQPLGDAGVPTRATLAARFPEAARASLDAERAAEAGDAVLARLWVEFRRLVSVRRVGDVEGTTTEDRLARAQAASDRGDFAGAVMEARGITGAAASALASWLMDAEARLVVDREITELNARIVQDLATPLPASPSRSPAGP
jgi:hypothetical protein